MRTCCASPATFSRLASRSPACVTASRSRPALAASRGQRTATVPKCKFDLEICGGIFVDEPCVVDGNLVSGRTYHDNGRYLGPWLKLLRQARAATTGDLVQV